MSTYVYTVMCVCVCVFICVTVYRAFGNALSAVKGSGIGQLCERENKSALPSFLVRVWFFYDVMPTALAYLAAGDARLTLKVA